MHSKLLRISSAIFSILLLAGGSVGTPIYNAISVSIPQRSATTLENIEKAIIRAGTRLGWKINPQGPGKAEGILVLRTHVAYVDIAYDTKVFNITYQDSINLDYVAKDKTIHSNYNGWIQNLQKGILVETNTL